MKTFKEAIWAGQTTTENALYLFDHLKSPDLGFMTGTWKGAGFPTNHSLDGLLEAAGWYGKAILDPERVHPLLFYSSREKYVFALNPGLLPLKVLNFPIPKNQLLRQTLLATKFLLQTSKHKARLRMIAYRNQLSAAMVYDNQPIIDVFRKVDDKTILGMMDMKKMVQPFFFVLRKDHSIDIR